MRERILQLALAASGGGETERTLLEPLCAAAEAAWAARLLEDRRPEECGEAFLCAAAFTAAADLAEGAQGVSSFSAGDISVNLGNGADRTGRAEALRQTAERLMEPFVQAKGLWAQGVEG